MRSGCGGGGLKGRRTFNQLYHLVEEGVALGPAREVREYYEGRWRPRNVGRCPGCDEKVLEKDLRRCPCGERLCPSCRTLAELVR